MKLGLEVPENAAAREKNIAVGLMFEKCYLEFGVYMAEG